MLKNEHADLNKMMLSFPATSQLPIMLFGVVLIFAVMIFESVRGFHP